MRTDEVRAELKKFVPSLDQLIVLLVVSLINVFSLFVLGDDLPFLVTLGFTGWLLSGLRLSEDLGLRLKMRDAWRVLLWPWALKGDSAALKSSLKFFLFIFLVATGITLLLLNV